MKPMEVGKWANTRPTTDVDIASLVVNFRYLQRSSPEDDPATHGTSLDFSLSDLD
jgi:hypothetical protein